MPDSKLHQVTITRTGTALVMAPTMDDAMEAANHIKTEDILWDNDWAVTDVTEVTDMNKE